MLTGRMMRPLLAAAAACLVCAAWQPPVTGAGPGDRRVVSVSAELDRDGDDRPERILRYSQGNLSAEARDTDGDGRLDTFDHFDADGNVQLREEDLDGDGAVDLRSVYQAGKLVRRELPNHDDT